MVDSREESRIVELFVVLMLLPLRMLLIVRSRPSTERADNLLSHLQPEIHSQERNAD
jgi:hypothetical protein